MTYSFERQNGEKYRHHVQCSKFSTDSHFLRTYIDQAEVEAEPWTIVGMILVRLGHELSQSECISDVFRVQYDFWVKAVLCDARDLVTFDVIDVHLLSKCIHGDRNLSVRFSIVRRSIVRCSIAGDCVFEIYIYIYIYIYT